MKTLLFFIMILLVAISPVTINATSVQDDIKNQMELKSKMSETEKNSFDYWCLSDYLIQIEGTKMEQYYADKKIDDEKISKTAEEILEKYSSDENYLFHHGEPLLDYSTSGNYISLLMDGENPLKMSKAQEIYTNYNYIIIDRFLIPESESIFVKSCVDTLENILDIKVPGHKQFGYKSFVNLRGEIVNISNLSIKPLLERGYLIYQAYG